MGEIPSDEEDEDDEPEFRADGKLVEPLDRDDEDRRDNPRDPPR
jgi:hypothetical protein